MTSSSHSHTLQLIVYHSRLFKAHWAVLVPHGPDTSVYTKVQVTGTLAQGFEHEFQREYDPEATGRGHSLFPLGSVPADAVASALDMPVDEEDTTTASNKLERIALGVPAPGPSLRAAGSDNVSNVVCYSIR